MRVLISSNPDPSWSILIHPDPDPDPDPPWSISSAWSILIHPDPFLIHQSFINQRFLIWKFSDFSGFSEFHYFASTFEKYACIQALTLQIVLFFSRLTWKLQGYNEMRENFIVVMFKQYYTTSKAPLQGVKELGSPPPLTSPDPFSTRSLLILVLLHSLIHLSPPLSCWSTALS